MNFETEIQTQVRDGLTVVILYEKYTCLRFTELISQLNK